MFIFYFPWRLTGPRNFPGSHDRIRRDGRDLGKIEISAITADRIRHYSRKPPVSSFRGRLRSLPATSCDRISKIAAPLLAMFENVRFVSNPVDPS